MQQCFLFSEACKGSRGSCRPSRLTVVVTLSVRCLFAHSGRLIAGGRKPGIAMNDVSECVVFLSDMTRLPVTLFFLFKKRIRYFSDFYHRHVHASSMKILFPSFLLPILQAQL